MNISFGRRYNGYHPISSPGAYEWWRFDAVEDNMEWSLSIVFYSAIPISPTYIAASKSAIQGKTDINPTDYSGYSVGIYHRGKKIYSAMHQGKNASFVAEQHPFSLHIGTCSVRWVDHSYQLELDTYHSEGFRRLKSLLRFHSESDFSSNSNIGSGPAQHTWIIADPVCRVEGFFEIFEYGNQAVNVQFSGKGYHDHNLGIIPIYEEFVDWTCGWAMSEFGVLCWRYYEKRKDRETSLWIGFFDKRTQKTIVFDNVSIHCIKKQWTFGGLFIMQQFRLVGTSESGTLDVVVHNNSLMENGLVASKMKSEIRGALFGELWSDEHGISERFVPSRLQNPLVNVFQKIPFRFY